MTPWRKHCHWVLFTSFLLARYFHSLASFCWQLCQEIFASFGKPRHGSLSPFYIGLLNLNMQMTYSFSARESHLIEIKSATSGLADMNLVGKTYDEKDSSDLSECFVTNSDHSDSWVHFQIRTTDVRMVKILSTSDSGNSNISYSCFHKAVILDKLGTHKWSGRVWILQQVY